MFCPHCGQPTLRHYQQHEYYCACGFRFFHNAAAAVAAIIQLQDTILVTRRARAPGQGQLDFPGGFVDPGETLEQALCRELNEELALCIAPEQLIWFGSQANVYPFAGVTYSTCDAYFRVVLQELPPLHNEAEISEHLWLSPAALSADDFAFESSKRALQRLRSLLAADVGAGGTTKTAV